ncbi:MAG: diguanylate cyclase domain-containing protein [Gammaproteobacteria bacterium]
MMQSEQTVSAGAQQAARAGYLDMLLGETMTEAGVGAVMSVTAAAILWAPDTQAMLLGWLGWMAVLYGVRLGLCWGYQRWPSRNARATAWSVLFTLGVAGTFLTWGLLGIAMYGRATPYQQGFVLLLTACMVLATLAIYRGAALAVTTGALAALLSPAGYFLMQGDDFLGAAGGALAIFTVVVIAAALRLDGTLSGYFHLHAEHRRLTGELRARQDELGKLGVTAKTSLARCGELESALDQTTTNLVAATRRSDTLADTLVRVAPHCPVTGLTNRRRFQEIVHVEWRRLMREGRPLSLIMFDLDDGDGNAAFYRSVAGSACLCRIAEVARGHARRAGDTASRYGETRFGILMPGADTATARRIAEDLRRAIEAHWIAHPIPGASPTVTVHVGVATLVPSPISGPEDLLGRAEDAMYQAAFQGGNRVVGYQALDTFGLVRWNPQADGSPTERALVDKLSEWGYRAGMTYQSPDKTADRCPDVPSACAVVSGRLGLSIEGQSFELDIGDCLFLPKGKTYSVEVLGNDPVWLLDASKSS